MRFHSMENPLKTITAFLKLAQTVATGAPTHQDRADCLALFNTAVEGLNRFYERNLPMDDTVEDNGQIH
jgi:hypothetical protein